MPLRRVLGVVALLLVAIPGAATDEVVSNCSNDVELRADLAAIQSGGDGTLTFSCNPATIVLTADLPEVTTPTIVDGGNKITISGGNSRRIFTVGGGATLTLKNIVLTNGSASGDGGAIFSSGSLVLNYTTVRNSVATLSGGAVVSYGPVLVQDSEFAFNEAAGGGAIYARFQAAPVSIERSWIHDNDGGAHGGALYLWDGADATIRDSELSGNTAFSGGAVYNGFSNSSVTIERSRLHDNASTGGPGGAIAMEAGPLVIVDSQIHDNDTITEGGGLFYKGSSADVRRTTFFGNDAASTGGAVSLDGATSVSLTNVTLSGNHANNGGALWMQTSSGVLSQTTIASNVVAEMGGGLYLYSGSFLLTNTLLSGNAPGNCTIEAGATLSSSDGNVSSDASCSSAFSKPNDENSASTLLGPLASNGGLTLTHLPGPGSDAIDASLTSNAPVTDQRGVPRPQGAAADAGAVEVATCGLVICGDANHSETLSAADALRVLQFSVGSASSCPLWACDYNGSETITAADALAILRASVGTPSSPACPEAWDCHRVG